MRGPLDRARAPAAPLGARLYESHYLTAVAPGGGRAVWLRYTANKECGEPARGTLWCTLFAAAAGPIARRGASARPLGAPPAGGWARIDGATIAPGRAEGALEDCTWSVSWRADAPALPYLPRPGFYDRPLPRSNGVALAPAATFDGRLEIAGEHVELRGWRGMVGHNWGVDHADRWIWLHATGLGDRDPDGWLDLILARVRVGGRLSPWLPAGGLCLDGALHRVKLGRDARGLRVESDAETLTVALPRLPGGGLEIVASSPAASAVHWDYASPGGGGRQVRNCSIASARFALGGGEPIEIEGSVAVEIGG